MLPYFKPPVDEIILRRYILAPVQVRYIVTPDGLTAPPTMFLSAPGGDVPFVLEKAPVNEKHDTRLEVSMGYSGAFDLEYYSYTNGIPPAAAKK